MYVGEPRSQGILCNNAPPSNTYCMSPVGSVVSDKAGTGLWPSAHPLTLISGAHASSDPCQIRQVGNCTVHTRRLLPCCPLILML